jgi:hypothetical protein
MKSITNPLLITCALLLTSSFASASAFVSCGTNYDEETGEYEEQVLAISSEDDDFNGALGGTWEMKMGDKDWAKPTKKVQATMDDENNVVIKVTMGVSPTGPVGKEFNISNIYADNPTLEIFTMGGFTGRIKTGAYECTSSND